jgi:hypothetical protein
MTISLKEFAAMLDGREYGSEISEQEIEQAGCLGYLVVYGYSDDNVELRGVVDEEIGAWDGKIFKFDRRGVQPSWNDESEQRDKEQARAFFSRENIPAFRINAEWCPERQEYHDLSWLITLEDYSDIGIKWEPFTIFEDGEPFCRGFVADLSKWFEG